VTSATPRSDRPNRLRLLRESDDLSHEALAVEFGVTKETIQYWEQKNIPSKWLRPLANRFRVSVDFLLGDGEEEAA
jgi:transcriptional regulator with XRE-family HTH domain